jgi:hypothetical protein
VTTTQKYRDNEAIGHETLDQLQDQAPSDLTHSKKINLLVSHRKKVASCCLIKQSASSEPTPNRKRSRSTPQKQARRNVEIRKLKTRMEQPGSQANFDSTKSNIVPSIKNDPTPDTTAFDTSTLDSTLHESSSGRTTWDGSDGRASSSTLPREEGARASWRNHIQERKAPWPPLGGRNSAGPIWTLWLRFFLSNFPARSGLARQQFMFDSAS